MFPEFISNIHNVYYKTCFSHRNVMKTGKRFIRKKTWNLNLITDSENPGVDFTNPGTDGTVRRFGIPNPGIRTPNYNAKL